jgi:hypothetical protein
MISNVPYPAMPTFSVKTLRGVLGLVVFIGLAFGLIFLPKDFFFPVGMLFVLYGLVSAVVRGLLDRPQYAEGDLSGADDSLFDEEDEDDVAAEDQHRRRRRRRFRGQRHKPDRTLPEEPTA